MWPQLPLNDWAETQTTLHRWVQIVGKTRLALAPMQNHWWQCALYLTARGLGTSPMPYAKGNVELEFDFLEHRLVARTSDGATKSIPLAPRSVADFYHDYLGLLAGLRYLNLNEDLTIMGSSTALAGSVLNFEGEMFGPPAVTTTTVAPTTFAAACPS